jgi:hypothetical protein
MLPITSIAQILGGLTAMLVAWHLFEGHQVRHSSAAPMITSKWPLNEDRTPWFTPRRSWCGLRSAPSRLKKSDEFSA